MGEANFYYFTCSKGVNKMFYKNKPVPVDLKTPIYPGGPTFRVPERLAKTRELQAHFLATDGKIPIRLARGARAVIPYRMTMGLAGFGMVYLGYVWYRMAYGI